jgi:SM-20-related protein
MLSSIERSGYYCAENWVSPTICKDLRTIIDERNLQGLFKPAGVGKGPNFVINEQIRSDSILWVENQPQNPLISNYLSFVKGIIPKLNRYFFLPIKDVELMFALYEPGSHYTKHKDRFESQPHRLFTIILYLTDWDETCGGELVLFLPERKEIITPKEGTLLIFNSELEHEVLITHTNRYSITGWLTDVPLGLSFL